MIEVRMTAESTTASILKSHPFTKDFWPEHVARLAVMASEVRFQPGELIFHEGDHSSFFYLLLSGNVALEFVSPGHPLRVATLYAGEVLGWSSVTGDTGKQFQARALEEVHALAFDGARLRHACSEDYAFGFRFLDAILSVTSGRIHSVCAQLLGAGPLQDAKTAQVEQSFSCK
jgi:CRP/FNR family transcriptional regulator, cyclic AMP receptor protein